MTATNPQTTIELLALIADDRATLDEVIAALSDEQLAARAGDPWSAADHLAHMAAWERMIVAHLSGLSDHLVAGMDEDSFAAATLDEINGRLHDRTRDRPLAETLREYGAAHVAIVEFIEAMPDAALSAPYWNDEPGGRTVLDKIAGDTYLHYREHAEWIQKLVAYTGP